MIYNAKNIEISINDSGILASNASLNVSPNISPIQSIGMSNFHDYQVDNGIISQITFSYLPEVHNEPNFGIVNGIKSSSYDHRSFQIKFAGITGDYYLQSYNFSVNELNAAQASATYVCYHQLSGTYAATNHITYDSQNLTGIAHAWSTYAEKQDDSDINVINFNYTFNTNTKPFYNFGGVYPHQVMHLGSNESYTVVRGEHSTLNYSGANVEHFYGGLYKFRCAAISGLNVVQTPEDLTFNVYEGRVTNQDIVVSVDETPLVQTTIIRNYN